MRKVASLKPRQARPRALIVKPDPLDPRLSERVAGVDQTGERVETAVVVERALTIFLNSQEIVTAMTIGDYPEYLAIGYLLNQIRLNGENSETINEIVNLSVRYGIITPYTSFLVEEPEMALSSEGRDMIAAQEYEEAAAEPPAAVSGEGTTESARL